MVWKHTFDTLLFPPYHDSLMGYVLSMSKEPTLPESSSRVVLADQHLDEQAWLDARKGRLTASDLYSWVSVDLPSWWSTTRESIIDEKVHGVERMFGSTPKKDADARRKMAWGRALEEPYLYAFADACGLSVRPLHALLGHERWPGLAATLDAVCANVEYEGEFADALFSAPEMVAEALGTVYELGTGIIEMKSTAEWSFKKTWLEKIPDYYQLQPRLQMCIAEVDWCLVVCGCGQDMTAHAITWQPGEREEFEELLDHASAEFLTAIKEAA